jgi:hypothetical protein
MSPVSDRHTPSTAAPDRKTQGKTKARSGAASFEYGWRDVPRTLPNGRVEWEQIPLTLEDVLHLQYGDVHGLSRLRKPSGTGSEGGNRSARSRNRDS